MPEKKSNAYDPKRSLENSFYDGTASSMMTGLTQDYFTQFLLLIGGSASHVGLLNAIPNLAASLVQLKSADLAEKLKSRRKVITTFVVFQALMLIPMAAIAVSRHTSPLLFILLVTAFTCIGAFAGPAWASLMGDLVSEDKRGEYFGWRNRTLGFVLVGSTFAAGLILQYMKGVDIFIGFGILFASASICRMVSAYFLGRMDEPPMECKRENYFTFYAFLRRVRESNFAKFVVFIAAMNFSVNLAAPYFAVLMLKNLHFSYLTYTVLTITATLTIYLTIGRWGKTADKYGNLTVIKSTAIIIAILPILWVVSLEPAFLFAAQILSGFAWAGFNLSASNFIYDSVTPPKRTRCIAYFNVLNGAALCCGAIIGGYLTQVLPPVFGYPILALFLVSGPLRLAIAILGPMNLKEVRPVEKGKSQDIFFSVIGVRPHLGIERKTIRY